MMERVSVNLADMNNVASQTLKSMPVSLAEDSRFMGRNNTFFFLHKLEREHNMKVRHLIELLKNLDEKQEVGFAYNYGDYGKTAVVSDIRLVDYSHVVYSGYHRMYRLADENDIQDEENEVTQMVVLQ
jgi:hypothetical protein